MDNPDIPDTPGDAYDLVVLAGGAARRMGGVDKVMLELGGRPLLARVLAAGGQASSRVVVGPRRAGLWRTDESNRSNDPSEVAVIWAREDPPGGGPLAALAAGLAALPAPSTLSGPSGPAALSTGAADDRAAVVVVLAGDMPMVDAELVGRLVRALTGDGPGAAADGVLLADPSGHRQPLAGAYRRAALDAALERIGDPRDQPMRALLAELDLADLPSRSRADPSGTDVDTYADLENLMLLEWVRTLAAELGIAEEMADLEVDAILDLARDAAHAVERPAAPISAFLVGYAAAVRAGHAGDRAEGVDAATVHDAVLATAHDAREVVRRAEAQGAGPV